MDSMVIGQCTMHNAHSLDVLSATSNRVTSYSSKLGLYPAIYPRIPHTAAHTNGLCPTELLPLISALACRVKLDDPIREDNIRTSNQRGGCHAYRFLQLQLQLSNILTLQLLYSP